MQISPHLCFDGQCRTAFMAYQRILGGTFETMLTYGESPMASEIAPEWHDRIVHVTLKIGDVELTGVDLLPEDYRKPQGFFVTLTFEDSIRAQQVFSLLAERGTIQLPFQSTFWSSGFGVLEDQFGMPWEINSAGPAFES